jgi:adenylyltransferase/sulfurtransferase
VGHLTIVDRDFVELNNLQRQVLFDEDDVRLGLPKAIAAERKLRQINSQIRLTAKVLDVNWRTIGALMAGDETRPAGGGVDLILDGTDNFETRFLINDLSAQRGVPWIYGACVSAQGLAMVVRPGQTPCLRCVFESIPPAGTSPTCETAGVLAAAVQIVASWQSAEALKLLSGALAAVSPFMLSFDLWQNRFQQINVQSAGPRSDCPVCALKRYEFLTGHTGSATTTLCGRNAVQVTPGEADVGAGRPRVDFDRIAEALAPHGLVTRNAFLLKCCLHEQPGTLPGASGAAPEGYELTLFADGRAIIKGTSDPAVARALYARYIGS